MNLLPAFVGTPEVNKVYHVDALTLLRALPAGSVDAVITDPPYYNVLDVSWDRQWENRESFICWLRPFLLEFKRVLKPNGSLFLFAWPKLAAHVEVEIAQHFNVLNSIVWDKQGGSRAGRSEKEALRSFFPNTERIIFAEQNSADIQYASLEYELNGKVFFPLKDWFRSRAEAHQITLKQLNAALGSATNGGGLASSYFGKKVEFQLPTRERYQQMRAAFPEAFNREYNDLQREYEALRREYEALRRPFSVTALDSYTDVWRFYTSQSEGTLHPAQKPINLMEYIARVCTKENGLILDPFMGSGTTLRAAKNTGRRFIGCDLDAGYVDIARQRLAQPYTPNMFLQAAGE